MRWCVGVVCLIAAGCAGGRPEMMPSGHRLPEYTSPVVMLQTYAGGAGSLSRGQLEDALKAEFAAADLNHTGVLDPDEARAVNQKRWNEDRSAVSPLQDWNADGVIDFNEFAAGPRALFREMDQNRNGVLSEDELFPGRAQGQPRPQNGGPDSQPSADSPNDGQGGGPDGRRGGRRGGGSNH